MSPMGAGTDPYDECIARVERTLDVLTWMVGTNIGLTLVVLGRLFTL